MGLRTFLKLKKVPKEKHVKVGNFNLLANGSHLIDYYLREFKYYSRNLARIAKYLESKYVVYTIIDVGANIGDTIALLRTEGVNQLIHSVEGDPIYISLINRNLSLFEQVKIHPVFLGEESRKERVFIDHTNGTANISTGSGTTMSVVKLDDLVDEHIIEDVKLLKTDTDGFDFNILRGAFDLIERDKPVLFFEYDAVFLKQQNDDGLSIFKDLLNLGYNKVMYYDNFGKFLLSAEISNELLLQQLYMYINKKEDCAFPYFDVCVFHQDDNKLADFCIENEMEFYK